MLIWQLLPVPEIVTWLLVTLMLSTSTLAAVYRDTVPVPWTTVSLAPSTRLDASPRLRPPSVGEAGLMIGRLVSML